MNNTITYTTATCTCANQDVLAPGTQCDICMGMVADQEWSFGDVPQPSFSVDYFEELEQYEAEAGLAA